MEIPVLEQIDFYKADHRRQYPDGTELVFSNLTPRKSRTTSNEMVFFGLQYFIKEYLIYQWNKTFFNMDKDFVLKQYKRRMDTSLGKDAIDVKHIEELHDLGYLPIEIRAIPEGESVPMGIPVLTIVNTNKKFFWITNYLESILSNITWKGCTSATTAKQYLKTFYKYAELTGYDKGFVQWQGHDFAFRGMGGLEDAVLSSSGHLLSFTGTDTVPALSFLEQYYNADAEKELIGGSVPATEHSVMSLSGNESEFETFKRLITEVYPSGIVSIVSDTWDLWTVLTDYLPRLKDEIMARDGRVVIRPDSGDPANIICGGQFLNVAEYMKDEDDIEVFKIEAAEILDELLREETPHGEYGGPITMQFLQFGKLYDVTYDPDWNRHDKQYYFIDNYGTKASKTSIQIVENNASSIGGYELLWNIFGGVVNKKGFKELDTHIGLIYGDSITLERQDDILNRLMQKGFAASNLVLGIGSYTYVYVTRDTYGMAMKATFGIVNGVEKNIFKDPITDSGFKKSAKGRLAVMRKNGKLILKQELTKEEYDTIDNVLIPVFKDGKLLIDYTLQNVRDNIRKDL